MIFSKMTITIFQSHVFSQNIKPPPSPTLPHQEVDFTFPPFEFGWVLVSALPQAGQKLYAFWGLVIKGQHSYCRAFEAPSCLRILRTLKPQGWRKSWRKHVEIERDAMRSSACSSSQQLQSDQSGHQKWGWRCFRDNFSSRYHTTPNTRKTLSQNSPAMLLWNS